MHTTTFVPSKKQADGAARFVLHAVFEAGAVPVTAQVVDVVDGLRIGREVAGDNALTIAGDHMLSRSHASFHVRSGALTVVDDSSNGTFVNGARSSGESALADRDVVRAGQSLFVVRLADGRPVQDVSIAGFLGASREMRKLRATVALMAPTDSTVLLLGETGTGKEVAAHAVHALSGKKGPFIALNCAAIPETLAESQLFGHVAGAFTGAVGAELGAFRAAQGGTLFLDEIGELSLPVQAKLLRALENREVVPVGSSSTHKVDARVVCATHQELVKQTRRAGFRADLYARIAELVIRLPPLLDRREDVLLLLATFLGPRPISVELAERLLLHPWPFNVRELKKLAAHLALHKDVDVLDVDLVADRLRETVGEEPEPLLSTPSTTPATAVAAPVPTRDELVALLHGTGGNIVRIAKETGRSRKSVYRWIEQHGLNADDYRATGADDDDDEPA